MRMGEAKVENRNGTITKLFVIISVAFVTCLLLSNLIAGKIILVFGLTLPAAVILFPLTYIFADIFTEVYGFRRARLVIWLGFICNTFAVMVYFITIALPYPEFWTGQEAYQVVLASTPRILAASLVGYLFGEFSNSAILSKLKIITQGKRLWIRTIASTVIGQAFDTILFISIAFWGTMPTSILFQMMLFQYLWKVVFEVILTPATYAVVKKMKTIEGIDVFDHGVKYNPFR